MPCTRIWAFLTLSALFRLAGPCQTPALVSLSKDPLELANGDIHAVNTPSERAAIINLLDQARLHYSLRTAGFPYELKVSFTVNSGGATRFDGEWSMEDMFDPSQGLRWTAQANGYSIIQINSEQFTYQDSPSGPIPLRLHEARVHLLGPMMPKSSADAAALRTVTAHFNRQQLTCVLLSGARIPPSAPDREWNEMVECIDPATNLLRFHSPARGLYILYDYANALYFHGQILPRKATVVEAGKSVIEEHLNSLADVAAREPALFAPTEQMKTRGPGIGLASLVRDSVSDYENHLTAGSVIVFGLLTDSGEIADSHVLDASDPSLNDSAIKRVQQMKHSPPKSPKGVPLQREIFVKVTFASGQ